MVDMSLRRKVSLVLLFFIPYTLSSQIFPKEGSKLNYRLIGFSFPQMNEGKCTLSIAKGNNSTLSAFNKNIIKSIECENGKTIVEVPAFGCDYTWAVNYQGRRPASNELHHFSTLISPKVDTGIRRFRIASAAKQYKDAYVFLDFNQVLYDMDGNPVWFLPDSSFSITESTNVRDVKLSPFGTITFMTDDEVYEINYEADILWKGPVTAGEDGENSELYHHEFTRLNNGHYMALGSENQLWKLPGYLKDSANTSTDITLGADSFFYKKMRFGTVNEYDQKGNMVWSWKSSGYFKESDLFKYESAGDLFDIRDVHENSFYFDEKDKVIYVSFRNLSRIVKVAYPEGKVIAVYGRIYQPGMMSAENDLFCGQHSISKTAEGYLCLFNNNSLTQNSVPRLVIMEEPADPKDDLKKIWEYSCTLDGLSERELHIYSKYSEHRQVRQTKNKFSNWKLRLTSGGNVCELPDGSLFASMSMPFSKTFIVTKSKEIIWNAIPEQRPSKDSLWNVSPTYRASIIADRKGLERLIWNGKTGKQSGNPGKLEH